MCWKVQSTYGALKIAVLHIESMWSSVNLEKTQHQVTIVGNAKLGVADDASCIMTHDRRPCLL